MKKPEGDLGLQLPARDDAAVADQPGEQALDLPAALVAAQRATILGLATLGSVGRDELDAVLVLKLQVERIAVVRAVANQLFGRFFGESDVESVDDELALSS